MEPQAQPHQVPRILLVEDSEEDFITVERAFLKAGINLQIKWVTSVVRNILAVHI